jgi:hypothetical protein
MAALPDQTVQVGGTLSLTNAVFDTNQSSSTLTVGLPIAPPGAIASLIGTNVVIFFSPDRSLASTTNLLQVVVTDNGLPSLSATQTFLLIVPDYVQADPGTVFVRSGQSGCVPINLFSSVALTNLQFTLNLPAQGLGNFSLNALLPTLTASFQTLSATQLLVNLAAASGHTLQATQQQVADFCFTAGSVQTSVILPLVVTAITPLRSDGSAVLDTGTQFGQVIVVGENPFLVATLPTPETPMLTLYGIPNITNTIEAAASLSSGVSNRWQPVWQGLLTNFFITVPAPLGTNNSTFFRAFVPKN